MGSGRLQQRSVVAGPCPGWQTIARAALAGVVHVLRGAPGGWVVTDCLGVYRKCEAIRNGLCTKERLLRGTNADLWEPVWEALKANQNWSFEWVPSHKSEEEAAATGISQDTWRGNEMADKTAQLAKMKQECTMKANGLMQCPFHGLQDFSRHMLARADHGHFSGIASAL